MAELLLPTEQVTGLANSLAGDKPIIYKTWHLGRLLASAITCCKVDHVIATAINDA